MFGIDSSHDAMEQEWLDFFYKDTPNGALYAHNSLHDATEKEDVVLVHATQSLDAIKRSGLLYPSVGCLGATIFTAPLNPDGKLHNFTQYMLDTEIPAINRLAAKKAGPVSLIGIKVKKKLISPTYDGLGKFNYLYLGPMQFDTYIRTKQDYNTPEYNGTFEEFENDIVNQVKAARPFLNSCGNSDGTTESSFFLDFEAAISVMPLLGCVYFETLSEYVQLFQQDEESVAQKARGELATKHLKDLVYTLSPDLCNGFDLEKFQPSIDTVTDALVTMNKERGLFLDFDEGRFRTFMKKRLSQTIWLKLMDKKALPDSVAFDVNVALSGHILHRFIGEKILMRPFLWHYDALRAERIWNDWSQHGITVIENTVLPRGEVGINPLTAPQEYEVYVLHQDTESNLVTLGEKLDVRIANVLVNGNSLMGSSNNPTG